MCLMCNFLFCLSALIFILLVSRVWGSRRPPVFKPWSRNPQHLQPQHSSLLWRCPSWSVRRWRQSARGFRGELWNQTGKWATKSWLFHMHLSLGVTGISQSWLFHMHLSLGVTGTSQSWLFHMHLSLGVTGISHFLWISQQLLGGEKQTGGFWTFEYYQSFFNVDTMQVHLFSH